MGNYRIIFLPNEKVKVLEMIIDSVQKQKRFCCIDSEVNHKTKKPTTSEIKV